MHTVLAAGVDKETALNSVKNYCSSKLSANHMPTLVKVYDAALPVALSGKLNVAQMKSDTKDLVKI